MFISESETITCIGLNGVLITNEISHLLRNHSI